MPRDEHSDGPARPGDIRRRGFADRVPVEAALRWIDAQTWVLPARHVDVADAGGHLLAEAITAPHAIPPVDRLAENGYALRADDTSGAGNYNPLLFRLVGAGEALAAGDVTRVVSGAALPPGADAVLSFDAAEASGATLDVLGEVARGWGIERQGQQAAAGAVLIEPGRRLRAQDLGLLAALGLTRVLVAPQPRVKLIVAGPKSCGGDQAYDACGPMLGELVHRDGGAVTHMVTDATTQSALRAAMAAESAEIILVVGRTGTGEDDVAPLALGEVGELSIHGIALRPGGSAGLGRVGEVPVILLPGDPLACLCVYELLAGRLIRRLGRRDPKLPHPVREMAVARKIVSSIGLVDICHVRFAGDRVEPIGSGEVGGLGSAVRAEGFIIVPEALEGYAPGARVAVHLDADIGERSARS